MSQLSGSNGIISINPAGVQGLFDVGQQNMRRVKLSHLLEVGPILQSLVVGGKGKIGEFILPFLPSGRITSFDLKEIHAENWPLKRLARNITCSHMLSNNLLGGNRDQIQQVVVLSLPEEIFAAADNAPYGRRAKLFELLGNSGAGRSQTLVLFLNSVHQHAASVLDSFSGPVAGIHFMFRPGPDLEMSRQTAVVTVTDKKRTHHLWQQAEAITQVILERVGIGNVVTMSSAKHDLVMADIQFLSHSLFLTLADCYRRLPLLPEDSLTSAVQNTARRILRGQAHVYEGIARNNLANGKLLKQWVEQVGEIAPAPVATLTANVASVTERVAATFGQNHGSVSTPISRARKQISTMASEETADRKPLTDIRPALDNYRLALTSGKTYAEFFNSLAARFLSGEQQ